MPRTVRTPDFLHLHANVSRRVRNLETGVHPTAAETGYADTVYYTRLTVTNPKFSPIAPASTNPDYPAWQRHSGIVTLFGGVAPSGIPPDWTPVGAEEHVLTLPAGARPLRELIVVAPAPGSVPPVTTIRIEADGKLWVTKPSDVTASSTVRFEGANWPID